MEGVDPMGEASPLRLEVAASPAVEAQACFAFGSERQIRDTGKPSGPSTGSGATQNRPKQAADASLVGVQRLLAGRGIATFLDRNQLAAGLPWPAALEEALRGAHAVRTSSRR